MECTELHQYPEQCGQEVSRVGVDRRLENLCESLRPEAKSFAIRTYIIRAFGSGLNLARNEIKARATDYIRSGKTKREALDVPEINDTDPLKGQVLGGLPKNRQRSTSKPSRKKFQSGTSTALMGAQGMLTF